MAAFLAAVLAIGTAGCSAVAPGAGTGSATVHAEQWKASALRAALPAVVVVRGRDLVAQKLDSTTSVKLWSAPAETTPTLLAVDPAGGRIAVLLRAAPLVTFPAAGRFIRPPRWSDAGIVVLSADGSARRLAVHAQTWSAHYIVTMTKDTRGGTGITVRTPGSKPLPEDSAKGTVVTSNGSIDATMPDLVTSGAFAGSALVLTTQRAADGRWGSVSGRPVVLSADGSTTPLSDSASSTLGPVDQFCQLGGGGVLAVRAPDRFGGAPTQHSASLVTLRGSTLETASVAYSVGWQALGPVASAEGTAAFVYRYSGNVLNAFVVASLEATGWGTRTIDLSRAPSLGSWGPGGAEIDLAQAGPTGELLAPVRSERHGHQIRARNTSVASAVPASSTLVPLALDGSAAGLPSPVRVAIEDDPRTRTWTYLTRFGPH